MTALFLTLLSTAGVHAGRSGRTLHQQQRTVAPRAGPTAQPTRAPTPRPTGSSGGSGSPVSSGGSSGGSGSPTSVNPNGIFNPLGPSPFKETECKVLPQGQTYIVRALSPFLSTPCVERCRLWEPTHCHPASGCLDNVAALALHKVLSVLDYQSLRQSDGILHC